MKKYIVIAAVAICVAQREKLGRGTIKPESYFQPDQLKDLLRRKFIRVATEAEIAADEAKKVEKSAPAPAAPAAPDGKVDDFLGLAANVENTAVATKPEGNTGETTEPEVKTEPETKPEGNQDNKTETTTVAELLKKTRDELVQMATEKNLPFAPDAVKKTLAELIATANL